MVTLTRVRRIENSKGKTVAYRRVGVYKSARRSKKGLKRLARKLVNAAGEKKYIVTSSSGYDVVTISGYIGSISDIPQGDTDQTRDGDQVNIRSINLRYTLYGVLSADCSVRIVCFQWKELDSAAPTIADILSTGASNSYVTAWYNHDNRYRFKILYDKVHHFPEGISAVTANRNVMITKGFFPRIQFTATTTVGQYKIYIIQCSDDGLTPYPTIEANYKLNFTDS